MRLPSRKRSKKESNPMVPTFHGTRKQEDQQNRAKTILFDYLIFSFG
jgi:hypothetical protein